MLGEDEVHRPAKGLDEPELNRAYSVAVLR